MALHFVLFRLVVTARMSLSRNKAIYCRSSFHFALLPCLPLGRLVLSRQLGSVMVFMARTLSVFEFCNGFTRPISCQPHPLPENLIDNHLTLPAKLKITRILRDKSTSDLPIASGYLVVVFIKRDHNKRRKWSSPRRVLSFALAARKVIVPASFGRTMNATVEDVRPAIDDNGFTSIV